VSIVVAISAAFVRIDVWDNGTTGIPHMRDTDDGTEGGRGLHLVNQLARRWGFERSPGRTCCWACPRCLRVNRFDCSVNSLERSSVRADAHLPGPDRPAEGTVRQN
jgi:hypothetical protein